MQLEQQHLHNALSVEEPSVLSSGYHGSENILASRMTSTLLDGLPNKTKSEFWVIFRGVLHCWKEDTSMNCKTEWRSYLHTFDWVLWDYNQIRANRHGISLKASWDFIRNSRDHCHYAALCANELYEDIFGEFYKKG